MGNFKDTVTLHGVTAKKETEKALLCVIDDEEHWIPKSHIHDDSEVYEEGQEGDLVVSEWIANEKGLL